MREAIPPQAYRNYAIRASRQTHTRVATCQEVNCPAYEQGWNLRKEQLTPQQIHIATTSGRRYEEVSIAEGHTLLMFHPGQPCFSPHRVSLERPAFFFAGTGTPETFTIRRATKYDRPDQWRDDMHVNLDKIQEIKKRG